MPTHRRDGCWGRDWTRREMGLMAMRSSAMASDTAACMREREARGTGNSGRSASTSTHSYRQTPGAHDRAWTKNASSDAHRGRGRYRIHTCFAGLSTLGGGTSQLFPMLSPFNHHYRGPVSSSSPILLRPPDLVEPSDLSRSRPTRPHRPTPISFEANPVHWSDNPTRLGDTEASRDHVART